MDADKQAVAHNAELLEEVRVTPELLGEQRTLLRTELERFAAIDPVEVLQDRARVLRGLLLGVLAANGRALEVV